nr:hypothetical protein [Caballeronia grimmiae]
MAVVPSLPLRTRSPYPKVRSRRARHDGSNHYIQGAGHYSGRRAQSPRP